MEHGSKQQLVENLICSQSFVLSDNCEHYHKSEMMKIEARSSTTMHEFHGLDDQLQLTNVPSSITPFKTMPNPPPFPGLMPPESYVFHSTAVDELDIYEAKPFAESYDGGHGQVMDNFLQHGGFFPSNFNFTDSTGLGMAEHFNCQLDVKPISVMTPDEISCIRSAEDRYGLLNQFGANKSRALVSLSDRRMYKDRKKSHVVKGQWTAAEDR